jgi:hypothetical protein
MCLGVYLIMVTCSKACLLLVMCMDYTKKHIAKFEALIVRDMLGSVFVIGDVFGSMFEFGDVFGGASDVNKPTVCLHI